MNSQPAGAGFDLAVQKTSPDMQSLRQGVLIDTIERAGRRVTEDTVGRLRAALVLL